MHWRQACHILNQLLVCHLQPSHALDALMGSTLPLARGGQGAVYIGTDPSKAIKVSCITSSNVVSDGDAATSAAVSCCNRVELCLLVLPLHGHLLALLADGVLPPVTP
jgi:hypothetical protein